MNTFFKVFDQDCGMNALPGMERIPFTFCAKAFIVVTPSIVEV